MKTDQSGNLIWKNGFGSPGNNLGNSAIETLDGYIICGSPNNNSPLIKLDKIDGGEQFIQSTDNGGNDAFDNLVLTSNGIVAVGYINAEDNTNTFYTEGEGYMTFLDSNGVKISEIKISKYLSQAYRIYNCNNELYISGLTDGAEDYDLIKTDSAVNLIWHRTYGGNLADHCFGMGMENDGSICLNWPYFIWNRKLGHLYYEN